MNERTSLLCIKRNCIARDTRQRRGDIDCRNGGFARLGGAGACKSHTYARTYIGKIYLAAASGQFALLNVRFTFDSLPAPSAWMFAHAGMHVLRAAGLKLANFKRKRPKKRLVTAAIVKSFIDDNAVG